MKYHAIICLANLMTRDGRLNDESEARLAKACSLARSHGALLVTTGWDYRDDTNLQIGVAMRSRAVEHYQFDPGRILVDTTARDTVGDAFFTKQNICRQRGWQRICVVTSDYHRQRSQHVFRFVYGPSFDVDSVGVPSVRGEQLTGSEEQSMAAFEKTFAGVPSGDDDAIRTALYSAHPFYNGRSTGKLGSN